MWWIFGKGGFEGVEEFRRGGVEGLRFHPATDTMAASHRIGKRTAKKFLRPVGSE
jgi:hypothetical protein